MRTLAFWITLSISVGSVVGCKTVDQSSKTAAVESIPVQSSTDPLIDNSISNFGQAGPHLFRGGQLSDNEKRFMLLQKTGVKKIINLQYFHSDDDPKLCKKYAMTCNRHHINPLSNDWIPLKFDWKNFKAAFADAKASIEQGESVYIHCILGKDRTGALVTALRIYPTVCSGQPYDAVALEKSIADNYEEFGTSLPMRGLRAEAISWAKNPPDWLCK